MNIQNFPSFVYIIGYAVAGIIVLMLLILGALKMRNRGMPKMPKE